MSLRDTDTTEDGGREETEAGGTTAFWARLQESGVKAFPTD